jgi:hypothetical protein
MGTRLGVKPLGSSTRRIDYNMVKPHSSLGDRFPRELLEAHRQGASGGATLNLRVLQDPG